MDISHEGNDAVGGFLDPCAINIFLLTAPISGDAGFLARSKPTTSQGDATLLSTLLRREDVKMWRCGDVKMWRYKDVKIFGIGNPERMAW